MKKKLFTLFTTILLMFAFSISCFAAGSPSAEVITTEASDADIAGDDVDDDDSDDADISGANDTDDDTDGSSVNTSSTSPKTGAEAGGALIVALTAGGVALVAKKKYSRA